MQSNFVHVIDDDDSLRNTIVLILQEAGYQVKDWASGQSFLESSTKIDNSVIFLDLQMPILTGLGLISQLNQSDMNVQVVFISGNAVPSEVVSAFNQGASDFLLKPFDMDMLLAAAEKAMQTIHKNVHQKTTAGALITKFKTLTPREKILFEPIVSGRRIRDIATQLDLAEITVKVYKAKIMRKLGVSSLSELIVFSQSLNRTSTTDKKISNTRTQ